MNYNKNTTYVSPRVKTIETKAQNIICSSPNGGTEGFTIGNNSYTDDDWE